MYSKKFDPFEHQNLFYEYKLKVNNDEINQILLLTENHDVGYQKCNYGYLNILNFPILKNLKKQVIDILDKHKLLLLDNWSQLYNKENNHSVHCHYGSIYSGIIYLKGINPSPTIFYEKIFLNDYVHNFKKNTLLLFPSMIAHEVKPLTKNEERLIVSFNTRKI